LNKKRITLVSFTKLIFMTAFTLQTLNKKLAHLINSDLISVDRKREGEQESTEEESFVSNFKLVPVFGGTEQKSENCSAKYKVCLGTSLRWSCFDLFCVSKFWGMFQHRCAQGAHAVVQTALISKMLAFSTTGLLHLSRPDVQYNPPYEVLPATPSWSAKDAEGKKYLSTFSEAAKRCERSPLLGKNSFKRPVFFCRYVDPHSVGVRCVPFDFLRLVIWTRGSGTSTGWPWHSWHAWAALLCVHTARRVEASFCWGLTHETVTIKHMHIFQRFTKARTWLSVTSTYPRHVWSMAVTLNTISDV
jgi:hypothetical protein